MSVHPKLKPEIIAEIPLSNTEGLSVIDSFVHHYSIFTKIINLIIVNKVAGSIQPMLKMYADTSMFLEDCFKTGNIFENDCADYTDGMIWLFNEICPEGYIFENGSFTENEFVAEST
jgi:hypothetical protein